jgi:hypothetical protein
MGFSDPSTYSAVSRVGWFDVWCCAYQECAGHQHEHTFIANGLHVNGVCAVLYLLEREVLPALACADD